MRADPTTQTHHRPWPLPDAPWVLFQAWSDLLFAHWPVPAARLRALVPEPLIVDEFAGSAWVGLTPFCVSDLHPRGLPSFPAVSTFPELNVRTYVRLGGKPGVYFFSLDAGSGLAVLGARMLYQLPYQRADITLASETGWIRYRCQRGHQPEAVFEGRYRPMGNLFTASPGTLEHFLVERYCLYAVPSEGKVLRAEIHHAPWALQPAEAEIRTQTIAQADGIDLPTPERPPLLHFARRQEVVVWAPQPVGEPPSRARPQRGAHA